MFLIGQFKSGRRIGTCETAVASRITKQKLIIVRHQLGIQNYDILSLKIRHGAPGQYVQTGVIVSVFAAGKSLDGRAEGENVGLFAGPPDGIGGDFGRPPGAGIGGDFAEPLEGGSGGEEPTAFTANLGDFGRF
jgi:hypothetical protein